LRTRLRDLRLPLLAGVLLVAAALVLPVGLHGDSGEYLLMLESLHAHGSPELRPSDLAALRALPREGTSLDESRILSNYHRGRDGRLYDYHFWGYPLAGVPLRALAGAVGLDPRRALPLANALLLTLALAGVAGLPWTPGRRLLLGALLLFSPALAFLMWPHPEVFSFALVSLACALAAAGRPAAAVLAAALASIQNPPLLLLVGLLWLLAVVGRRLPSREEGRWTVRGWMRTVVAPTLAALPALVPAAFFEWQFGVFNLSVRPAEARQSLSWARASDLLLDPNLGVLWHAPLAVLLALAGGWRLARERRPAPSVLLVALVALLMFACTANSNWNNDTSGPSRYVVWMLPLLLFVAVAETGGGPVRPLGRAAAALLSLALVAQAGIVLGRGGPCARSDFLEHSAVARLLLDRWPRLYSPTPEVFVERTLGHEGPFTGPVVYRDAAGRCRKAWLQWRLAEALLARCGPPPDAGMARRLAANARRRERKRDWTYVDY
jgi:hypothetical protein